MEENKVLALWLGNNLPNNQGEQGFRHLLIYFMAQYESEAGSMLQFLA